MGVLINSMGVILSQCIPAMISNHQLYTLNILKFNCQLYPKIVEKKEAYSRVE